MLSTLNNALGLGIKKINTYSCILFKFRNVIAVAEKVNNKKPTISIYDLESMKRKKQLTVQTDLKTDNFINIKFSYDDTYLAALTNGPDFMMYYYNWENSKIESYVKASNPPNSEGPVLDVSHIPIIK